MAHNTPPLVNLLLHLVSESHNLPLMIQMGVLALAAALGWGLMRLLRPRMEKLEGTWAVGAAGLQKAGLPLAILACLWLLRQGVSWGCRG